jgi:hypothetical protein
MLLELDSGLDLHRRPMSRSLHGVPSSLSLTRSDASIMVAYRDILVRITVNGPLWNSIRRRSLGCMAKGNTRCAPWSGE